MEFYHDMSYIHMLQILQHPDQQYSNHFGATGWDNVYASSYKQLVFSQSYTIATHVYNTIYYMYVIQKLRADI